MATQEALHAGVGEEAQEDLARVAEHHDERHQRAAGPADGEMAEMAPIHLGLFPRQAAQAQVGLGFRPWPVAGDEVAEVIGAAVIAALAHHRIQAARGQRREGLERLADERQIRVDLRRAKLAQGSLGVAEGMASGGVAVARPRAGRPAPAHAAPRCGARAAGGRWCPPSISPRGGSAGSAPRCQAVSPWSGPVRSCRRRPRRRTRRRRNPWRTRPGHRRPHQ